MPEPLLRWVTLAVVFVGLLAFAYLVALALDWLERRIR